MTDFYVYRLNTDEKNTDSILGFISDLNEFVLVFNPSTMEFTGVKIIADDIETAKHVYANPTSTLGEYVTVDEPSITQALTTLINFKNTAHETIMRALTSKLASCNSNLNYLMSMLATAMYDNSNKIMTKQQIYNHLKSKWAEQFVAGTEFYE